MLLSWISETPWDPEVDVPGAELERRRAARARAALVVDEAESEAPEIPLAAQSW